MKAYIGDYGELVRAFLARGYRTVGFIDHECPDGELILRHDIDFDCALARDMAEIEATLGVDATYFFMLRSDSYNLLSAANAADVRAIKSLGHRVSLHFDPTLYDDFIAGFAAEKAIFEATFETLIEVVSIHRPNPFFLRYDQPISEVLHSYQRCFSKDIAYISDSQGRFRYGHPLESDAFAAGRSIHLLIHPIWWMVPNANSAVGLLSEFLDRRTDAYRHHMAENCIPYRDHLGGLR